MSTEENDELMETLRSLIKSAGGKSWLLARYRHLLPKPSDVRVYREPFCGSIAVGTYYLGRAACRISDRNERLILFFLGVRNDPKNVHEATLALIAEHAKTTDPKGFYLHVREAFNAEKRTSSAMTSLPSDFTAEQEERAKTDLVAQAARFLYLNKAGFNGLYRENRSGDFNVPYGKYHTPGDCGGSHTDKKAAAKCAAQIAAGNAPKKPHAAISIPSLDSLLVWSRVLSDARTTILAQRFDEELDRVKEGDFVFLDPPYVPANATTSNFTEYQAGGFGPEDQERLAAWLPMIHARGARFLLTNAISARSLYEGWHVREVNVPRTINSKADKRGNVGEIMVANFPLDAIDAIVEPSPCECGGFFQGEAFVHAERCSPAKKRRWKARIERIERASAAEVASA